MTRNRVPPSGGTGERSEPGGPASPRAGSGSTGANTGERSEPGGPASPRARSGSTSETTGERDALIALIADPVRFLSNAVATLRRMAVSALDVETCNEQFVALSAMVADEDPSVRAAVAEQLGRCGQRSLEQLTALSADSGATVREAVATAFGEIGEASTIEWLSCAAESDTDRTVREAAVASLGAIGHPDAIDPLLRFIASGPPQVRRRAIAAITVFDDERIESAIQRAALDRNPGVREAAEMVVGRQILSN